MTLTVPTASSILPKPSLLACSKTKSCCQVPITPVEQGALQKEQIVHGSAQSASSHAHQEVLMSPAQPWNRRGSADNMRMPTATQNTASTFTENVLKYV